MHLPKTAGMALRLFLGNQYSVSQILPADGWPELLSVDFSRIEEYRLFQGHFSCSLLDLLPQDVVTIVFLREPVARTISHLKHLRRDPNFHPANKLAAGRTLDDLVRDDRIMQLCCDSQCALLSYDMPGKAILADLRRVQNEGRAPNPDDFAGEPDLAKAEAMLDRFGFVGFVEDLQDDVMRLSMKFGFHPPRDIPRHNHDPEGETKLDSIDPETLAVVRRWNAADIALYEAARRRFSGRPRIPRSAVERELLVRGAYAPIRQPVKFAISGPLPGSNWYEWEDAAQGGHRWTGPLNETTLELPLAPGLDFELSLVVLIPDLNDLSAHLGDTELPIRRDASDRRIHRIAVHIPAALVRENGLTSLRLRTKQVFQPSETDIRILSFMVRELSISRVEPASLTTAHPQNAPSVSGTIFDAEKFVLNLFRSILHREPDPPALRHWVTKIDDSTDLNSVFDEFMSCDEFQAIRSRLTATPALAHPPGHFYSPIVNPTEIATDLRRRLQQPASAALPGISVDLEAHIDLWNRMLRFFREIPFPSEPTEGFRYHFCNPAYSYADGSVLYAMLRAFEPARLIEIGSGYSSACSVDTIERYLSGNVEVTFIEPYGDLLRQLLGNHAVKKLDHLELRVQDVPLELFDRLTAGDILFIDSTHVLKTGSDVCYELFEILPRLASGVLVHFHDIFWPFEYGENWALEENRSWNEIYGLRAFLTYNKSFEILFFNDYFRRLKHDLIEATFPDFLKNTGGAIWLRKR